MKNSGLLLNMAKWCFLGLFFWGFNIKRFVFGVSGIVSKVLKMLVCFPVFWGFSGVVHCCSSGFGRFRCFCVSCVCFSFMLLLFLLCLLCSWLFGWMLLFLFFFVFFLFVVFLFCFFGGFKGQVRWPKGPPHLTLNPPYFICFCCFSFVLFSFLFFFVFVCFCLEGLRVRWGGPLGPKPSLFYLFCVFFVFVFFFCFFLFSLSLLLLEKNCFPPKKGIFVYFSVSPFVSL